MAINSSETVRSTQIRHFADKLQKDIAHMYDVPMTNVTMFVQMRGADLDVSFQVHVPSPERIDIEYESDFSGID
jgi:hypothetical protein